MKPGWIVGDTDNTQRKDVVSKSEVDGLDVRNRVPCAVAHKGRDCEPTVVAHDGCSGEPAWHK